MSTSSHSGPQGLGKYELREHLGRGSMAEVWKAFDTQLQRSVALKILHADLLNDPHFIARFEREAPVIASLHHPNIVQVYDLHLARPPESESTLAYIVMDYVEGMTLSEYIRHTSGMGKFPSAIDIVQLFTPICIALDYAHQQGMIHRDIKPANILLDKHKTNHHPMGESLLTDFGFAQLMGVASATFSGMWPGTPLYISPEQAQGHPGNERSDIYSLGVILYEICAGVPPFQGESTPAIMLQHINSMPPPPDLINPNIPPALTHVILHCLAKDPAARFNNASIIVASVAEALGIPLPAEPGLPIYPPDLMNGLPSLSPRPGSLMPGMIPTTPSMPMSTPGQPPNDASSSNIPLPVVSGVGQGAPTAPVLDTAGGSSLATSPHHVQLMTPSESPSNKTPMAVPLPSPPSPGGRRRRGLFLATIAVLIIILLGAGLGSLYWLTHTRSAPIAKNQIVGHAYFVSSGQIFEHSNQGINDEVLIELQNIAHPAPGKGYYAWLLPDLTTLSAPPVALGQLPFMNGSIHYLYPGDTHHTNLIAITSRFLITEEQTNPPPSFPSPDKSTWRYYAQLPQTPESREMMHEGTLQLIRHLLADAPELMSVNLSGGLDIWLFRNVQKVSEWAGSARDFWERKDPAGILNQTIRILDYLDGGIYVHQDVPAGTPDLVNPRIAPLALLEFDQHKQNPPALLYLVGMQLSALVQTPGISREKQTLAAQIAQDSKDVQARLQQVRRDAKQLVMMTPTQLLSQSTLALLDDMETAASSAYAGQIDPNTNTAHGGIVQIHNNIQHLATYDLSLA
ncbi:MAG TPA: serine/threonine-protein kinase [Ktedonobacteraceae bacterium]